MPYNSEVKLLNIPAASPYLNSLLKQLHDEFYVSDEKVNEIIKGFHEEMKDGLSKHSGLLPMIPSYVSGRPTGKEKGSYLALDLGGTNLRVCLVTLNGDSSSNTIIQKFPIPKEAKEKTLFDWIAQCLDIFLQKYQIVSLDYSNPTPCGLTLAFPIDQTGIAKGNLVMWKKGFSVPNAIGRDFATLLQDAFTRKHINIKIVSMINDTVATLIAGAYSNPACQVGIVFGAGTNACYWEKTKNIKKWPQEEIEKSPEEMIINIEWGAFDNKLKTLPLTPHNSELIRESNNPGLQSFDKMISGTYLGEAIRHTLLWMIDRKVLLEGRYPELLNVEYSLDTSYVPLILADESPELDEVRMFIEGTFNIQNSTLNDRIIVKYVCELVGASAKRLSAAAMCAVLLWNPKILEKDIVIGIHGSMFKFYPKFAESLKSEARRVLGEERASRLSFIYSKDSSGIGAAVVAMAVSSST